VVFPDPRNPESTVTGRGFNIPISFLSPIMLDIFAYNFPGHSQDIQPGQSRLSSQDRTSQDNPDYLGASPGIKKYTAISRLRR
jgi:hypothetical protein